jgi:hypothetical protein
MKWYSLVVVEGCVMPHLCFTQHKVIKNRYSNLKSKKILYKLPWNLNQYTLRVYILLPGKN